MQPGSFGSRSRGQALPVGGVLGPGDILRLAGDRPPLAPGPEDMGAADAEHVAFAGPTQLLFDIADTIDGITGNPSEWYRRGYGARDHSRRKLWFGRRADMLSGLVMDPNARSRRGSVLSRSPG